MQSDGFSNARETKEAEFGFDNLFAFFRAPIARFRPISPHPHLDMMMPPREDREHTRKRTSPGTGFGSILLIPNGRWR